MRKITGWGGVGLGFYRVSETCISPRELPSGALPLSLCAPLIDPQRSQLQALRERGKLSRNPQMPK